MMLTLTIKAYDILVSLLIKQQKWKWQLGNKKKNRDKCQSC